MLCFAKLSHWQLRTSRASVNVDVVAVAVAVALIVIIILTANLRLSASVIIISVRGGKAVVGVFKFLSPLVRRDHVPWPGLATSMDLMRKLFESWTLARAVCRARAKARYGTV